MGPLGAIAAYGLGAWVYDVVVRPLQTKDKAIEAAKRRGKPVLNVGAGTPGSSIRVSVLGPVMWGDVNCDIAGAGYCTPQNVCHCDIHDIPYPDLDRAASPVLQGGVKALPCTARVFE